MENYEHRKSELLEELEKIGEADVDAHMEEIVSEVAEIDAKMSEANKRIRELQISIVAEADELEENSLLQDRCRMLHSQYEADTERLRFITEGDENSTNRYAERCPFCDHEITKTLDRKTYADSSKAELEKTQARLEDLSNAELETANRIAELEESIAKLQDQRAGLERTAAAPLQAPRAHLRAR